MPALPARSDRLEPNEFGRDLTTLLRGLAIRHTRIRPRSPHLNGKVERVQRTAQEEFWDGVGPGPVEEWERFRSASVRPRLEKAKGAAIEPPLRRCLPVLGR